MRINLPPVPPGDRQGFLTQLVRQLTMGFRYVVASDQAVPQIVLQSFDATTGKPAKAWSLTVSDTGTLVVTENTGHINAAGGHPP